MQTENSDSVYITDDLNDQPPSKLTLLTTNQNNSVNPNYYTTALESYKIKQEEQNRQMSEDTNGTPNSVVKLTCQPAEKMSKTNLYIKGLPDSFSDEKLWNLAPRIGEIKSVKAATDDDGKCRGYGFIDFLSEESANEALRHIKETYPAFTIKFAKENEKDKTNLYVTNLPKSWTTKDSDQLKAVFERFGTIQSAFVMMERSTNRTTGVGFVRYCSERDAQHALESLKNDPLILPDCTAPVEAKFADKHNPETRRRRYPLCNLLGVNGFMGYPMAMCNSLCETDNLNAMLNIGYPLQTDPLMAIDQMQNSKLEYIGKLPQGMHHGTVATKLANAPSVHPQDYGLAFNHIANSEANIHALAAATASTLLSNNPTAAASPYLNVGVRSPHPTSALPSNLSVNLISANPLSLFGGGQYPGTDASLLGQSGLFRCSMYGNDYYRQTQQQQQLLAAAMSSLGSSPVANSVYTPVSPELTSYLTYANLLNSQHINMNGTGMQANCVLPNGSTIQPVLTNHLNNLLNANSIINAAAAAQPTNSALTADQSIAMLSQRQSAGLQPWFVPTHVIKNGTADIAAFNHSSVGQVQEP